MRPKLDPTLQPLVSDAEIQQLLNAAANQTHGHLLSNQFAAAGEHPSELIGSGMDFADRQAYQRGDDPRYIDWRASARSSHTLVRRYHAELSAPSCIVIDRRASMLFGSNTRLKATQSIRAGIICGAQLLKAGQQLACLILDQHDYWQEPSNSLSRFSLTAKQAARACPPTHYSGTNQWSLISDNLTHKLSHGSRLVLISDFNSSAEHQLADEHTLRYLSQQFNLSLLHIIDPYEQQIKHSGIRLSNHVSHIPLNNHHDVALGNEDLVQKHAQFIKNIKALNCAYHHLSTADELKRLSVFQP